MESYSFKNVSVIWGEAFKEFGEGDDVVSVEPNSDLNITTVGAKGDVMRSQSNDSSCVITIKLLQSSATNKYLFSIMNTDRETGVGILPMIIEDKEAGQKFVFNNVWIKRMPTITRGQKANDQSWQFNADFVTAFYL